MSDAYALMYLLLSVALGWVLLGFLRRSEFGVVIAYAELFIFFGAFLYPAMYHAGFVDPAGQGQSFLQKTGEPGAGTLLHVTAYLLGAVFGLLLARHTTARRHLDRVYALAGTLIKDESAFFRNSLLIGIAALGAYILSLGWTSAIAYAASMRSGIFDAIDESDQHFLFLKSLATTFGFIVCFLPTILLRGNHRVVVGLYLVFTLMLYLVSISRVVLLLQLVVPLAMYLKAKSKSFSQFVFRVALAGPLVLLFLFYGKPLGFIVFAALMDGDVHNIEPYLYEYGFLGAIFGNFEFIWFSIEAGIRHFFVTGGPLLPNDVILSFAGFMPSRVWSYLDLSLLDYRSVEPGLSCINTQYFGEGCTIPPHSIGFAAYTSPVAGAFILATLKFFIYQRQELHFLHLANIDYSKTWYPFLFVLLASMLFSVIPTTLSQLAFLIVILALLFGAAASSRFLAATYRQS